MSASDKKKLRKEQVAAQLTEKQRQQQAEAKKLKAYSIAFVAGLALVLCIAVVVLAVRGIEQSGIVQKNTIAATIGGQELNTVELNYYYVDYAQEFYAQNASQYGDYADMLLEGMGLNPALPLDEQQNEAIGITWSQHFLDEALATAKRDIALYNAAMDASFTLPAEEQELLDSAITNLETYATIYGFANANKFLQASYGPGANVKSYQTYMERSAIADAFYTATEEGFTYDDAAIREFEKGNPDKYNSYTYDSIYMSYNDFMSSESEDEDSEAAPTEEERNAAREAVKAAAEKLATATTVEELKTMAGEIETPSGVKVTVTENKDQLHTAINGTLSDWLAADERKEGDIAAIANTSTTTDESGNETTNINGYYVALFHSVNDNAFSTSSVRHLLVKFDGGTEDETTGELVYTEEEMTAAKDQADAYLKEWKEGDATEESFIKLVQEHSDDTSAAEGGLFSQIHPGSSYVEAFLNWSIDPNRKVGDTEVIETEYGYHVMYYVGTDELNYRDHMITTDMRAADLDAWYNGLLDSVTAALADTSKMELGLVLSPATI